MHSDGVGILPSNALSGHRPGNCWTKSYLEVTFLVGNWKALALETTASAVTLSFGLGRLERSTGKKTSVPGLFILVPGNLVRRIGTS